MNAVTSNQWLDCARRGETEEFLRVAEEYECASYASGELPSLFFHVLVVAYLIHNDIENARLALLRWEASAAADEEECSLGLLKRTMECCDRFAYDEAFIEFMTVMAARGSRNSSSGNEVSGDASASPFSGLLLDYLAARYVSQRKTFYGETVAGAQAARLRLTPDDLAARLRRVEADERRRIGGPLDYGRTVSSGVAPEILHCVGLAGAS